MRPTVTGGENGPQGAVADHTPRSVPRSPSLLRYMPLAHPEVPSDAGTVAVSICRNSANPALLLATPEVYRPYFVSIELPPRPSRRVLDATD